MTLPPPDVNDADPPDDRISVADHELGKTRLLAAQCATCIFRPGNPMHLAPGRLRDMVEVAQARGGYIICHDTLPYADPPPGVQPAICRGFHDRYDTAALQLIRRLWGFTEVPPPPSPDGAAEQQAIAEPRRPLTITPAPSTMDGEE